MANQSLYALMLSLSCHLLFVIIITTDAADTGLQTRKGIIYGRHTQHSTEYLG
jgi:hypothetical protein